MGKLSAGMGMLLLCISLVVTGASCQKAHDRQEDTGLFALPSAGRALLEVGRQQEKEVTAKHHQHSAEGVEHARAFAKESTEIKLTWCTGKKTDQIRIFRANHNGKPYRWKRIAVLKGKKSSYVDSVYYDKEYKYEIAAYQKKGKKYKRLGSDFCYGFSGIPKIVWDEYARSDTVTTSESISIEAYAYTDVPIDDKAFKLDGFEIFRRREGKNFKRIKAVKQKERQLAYNDETVQGHQVYEYKVRAFRKIRNRKYYGAFSSVMKYTAVNSTGRYSVQVLNGEGDALSALTVCLTSEEGNADFLFISLSGDFYNESGSTSLVLEQYSEDGKSWSVPEENRLTLKAGQTMYLRFIGYDGDRYSAQSKDKPVEIFSYQKGERAQIEYIYGSYNHLGYILSIDLNKLTASATVDWEMYH